MFRRMGGVQWWELEVIGFLSEGNENVPKLICGNGCIILWMC